MFSASSRKPSTLLSSCSCSCSCFGFHLCHSLRYRNGPALLQLPPCGELLHAAVAPRFSIIWPFADQISLHAFGQLAQVVLFASRLSWRGFTSVIQCWPTFMASALLVAPSGVPTLLSSRDPGSQVSQWRPVVSRLSCRPVTRVLRSPGGALWRPDSLGAQRLSCHSSPTAASLVPRGALLCPLVTLSL